VDADGLNILVEIDDWWTKVPAKRLLLTPHTGEMGRLMGLEADEVLADPVSTAEQASKRFNQVVCFKTGYTVVTDGERTVVSEDAPASLATAGTGDVFAGMIGALPGSGCAADRGGGLATYVGCRAARRMEEQVGTLGLIASDLPPAIATELGDLERT
jgi:NAD(P)H-hydrate epimerase